MIFGFTSFFLKCLLLASLVIGRTMKSSCSQRSHALFAARHDSSVATLSMSNLIDVVKMDVEPKIGVGPQNGWFLSWKTLLKLDDLGGTPIFGNTQILQYSATCLLNDSPFCPSLLLLSAMKAPGADTQCFLFFFRPRMS